MASRSLDFSTGKEMEILKEFDDLVARQLENVGYRDLVNKKFEELNMGVDNTFTPIMKQTQVIFDETLREVEELEAQEKILGIEILGKEIHSLMAADVIVLDDDDEPEPEKNDSERKNKEGSQNATSELPELKPEMKSENLDKKNEADDLGLYTGLRVLAKKRTQWFPATIIDIFKQDSKTKYKVRYDMNRGKSKVQANHLACLDTPHQCAPGQIQTGSRIAAHYRSEGIYSGIVAEAPDRKTNKGRYLIFFDDGYAMYCQLRTVYLVYAPPANVWDDISYRHTAEYIKEYLSTPERPMLTMKVHQILKVEFQGEWHRAKCMKVDCSLVEVMYLLDNSREWIYRGSLRLEPLFKQSHNKMRAMQSKTPRRLARAHTGVRNAHIEYTTIDLTRDSSPSPTNSPIRDAAGRQLIFRETEDSKKNVGKKSTGGVPKYQSPGTSAYRGYSGEWKAPWSRSLAAQKAHLGDSPVTRLPQSFSEIKGGVDVASHILDRMSMSNKQNRQQKKTNRFERGYGDKRSRSYDDVQTSENMFDDSRSSSDRKRSFQGARTPGYYMMAPRSSASYRKHICGPKCVEPFKVNDISKLKGTNPLMKPLLLGWTREVSRMKPCTRGPAFHVYYRAPCGRMCRNMSDVDRYILETNLPDVDYDHFCFDYSVRTHSNISVHSRDTKFFMEDYSEGKEDIPIPCVNEINMERPPVMPYTKARVEGENVTINTSSDFMVCCDCPDNCRDRSSCPCQQLTVTATSCCRGAKIKHDAGYQYKRLYGFLPTGIYECSPKCKCNSRCPNRVVQKGLQCRLQMFKTHKKGWGIRCLDDIAKGTFVCVYTGKIQTEAKANEEGLANGDEYLAELDHIEVAERHKDDEDAGSSSGVDSEMDEEEEEDKGTERQKDEGGQSDDSGANTTDSEINDDRVMKHVTVTLKRAPDSKWTVKNNEHTDFTFEDKINGKVDTETKKDRPSNGRQNRKMSSKYSDMKVESSDSDEDVTDFNSRLAPPGEEDEVTTDTDSEYSNNERPPSCGPSSKNSDRRSSQSIGLHSSKMTSDTSRLAGDSSDDEEDVNNTRRYFGCSDTFIIDAKQTGNLGRYLNHSCAPNLLVQNVFIDTHDLRFPWVAFFATSTIRAGTELTWDYNYEIGSVEGREIQCYCGATKCRKRLL
uniref:histone-lysine N-methyltransferase SETDB1-like isoform X1 n=1 Tax=Styela clava TaxID=7725 RepID=UPI0019395023|nr:histone-lysine N-methyltransferase SETDB1-like isoform X1 [Styela clava]